MRWFDYNGRLSIMEESGPSLASHASLDSAYEAGCPCILAPWSQFVLSRFSQAGTHHRVSRWHVPWLWVRSRAAFHGWPGRRRGHGSPWTSSWLASRVREPSQASDQRAHYIVQVRVISRERPASQRA